MYALAHHAIDPTHSILSSSTGSKHFSTSQIKLFLPCFSKRAVRQYMPFTCPQLYLMPSPACSAWKLGVASTAMPSSFPRTWSALSSLKNLCTVQEVIGQSDLSKGFSNVQCNIFITWLGNQPALPQYFEDPFHLPSHPGRTFCFLTLVSSPCSPASA